MPRTETEPPRRRGLAGFDLDDSSYSLTKPESFLDGEEVNVAWPVDTAHGYRADIDFVSAGAGETLHKRHAAVLCDPGPGASNRQLVAQHCEISDPAYLTAWGDENTAVWSDGPIDYYVWTCMECGARQVDSPQDEWVDSQIACIECDCPRPFPWDEETAAPTPAQAGAPRCVGAWA